MALSTWTPSIPPSPPLPKGVTPRVLTSQFGDGYAAVAADGINTLMLEPFELQFLDIDNSVAEVMNTFMNATKGVDRFYYTLPFEGSARTFRAMKWGIEHGRDLICNFRVTLKEMP